MTNLTHTPPSSPSPAPVQPSPCSIWAPAEDELQSLSIAWDDVAFREKLGKMKSATPPAPSFPSLKESLRDLPQTDPRHCKGRPEKEVSRKRLFPESRKHTISFLEQVTGTTNTTAEEETSLEEFEAGSLQHEAKEEASQAASGMPGANFQNAPQPRFDAGTVAFSPFGLPPNTILVPTEDPSQTGQQLFRLMTLESGSAARMQLPSYSPQQIYGAPTPHQGAVLMPDASSMAFKNMQLDPTLFMPPVLPPMLNNKFFCLVEFKRGRTLQYESPFYCAPGEYVIVGGDRGEDLGMVTQSWVAPPPAPAPAGDDGAQSRSPNSTSSLGNSPNSSTSSDQSMQHDHLGRIVSSQDHAVGRVIRRATPKEVHHLHTVQAELEKRCTDVCQQKVREHGLVLVVVDAEYQFDRKKLTFYYDSAERQDFRDLVRDLYKIYRARIWMSKVNNGYQGNW